MGNLDWVASDPGTYVACTGGTAIAVAPAGIFDAFTAQASTVHVEDDTRLLALYRAS